jgi:hypothetical protein
MKRTVLETNAGTYHDGTAKLQTSSHYSLPALVYVRDFHSLISNLDEISNQILKIRVNDNYVVLV